MGWVVPRSAENTVADAPLEPEISVEIPVSDVWSTEAEPPLRVVGEDAAEVAGTAKFAKMNTPEEAPLLESPG